MERTLVLLKPDCVQRRLMGQIISRFENKGLNIIAMKLLQVTPDLAKQHYAEHVEKPFYPGLEAFHGPQELRSSHRNSWPEPKVYQAHQWIFAVYQTP